MQVEHEVDQRPLQPRARAHVHGETRAGELGRAFEIENAERFADFPVRLGRRSRIAALAPGLDGHVVGFGDADGNFVAGEVGNAGQRQAQLLVERGRGLVELVELVLERAGLVHHEAVASWPAFFSAPTCWLSSLRRALHCSERVMASRRLWSSARKSPSSAAGSAPRARSFSSPTPDWREQKLSRASLFHFTRPTASARRASRLAQSAREQSVSIKSEPNSRCGEKPPFKVPDRGSVNPSPLGDGRY